MKIELIIKYMDSLTKKDQEIAKELLDKRFLYDLKDLVDSSIIIYKREIKKENPKREIAELDEARMSLLKNSVDTYLMNIDPSYFEDINESDYEEEFYT